jgi:hypothetical protein
MDLTTFEDIDAWVEKHGIEALWAKGCGPAERQIVEAWLQRRDRRMREESHQATRRSADASASSARMALFAIPISLAALFVAAWPSFHNVLEWALKLLS